MTGAGTRHTVTDYHYFDAAPAGFHRYRLLQQDGDGTITAGPALDVFAGIIPEHSALHQNHPNPFNPSTVITYHLAKNGAVKLSVFDIEGKEVRILTNTYQPAGSYAIRFSASGLPSGMYVYRLLVNGMTFSKKMLFIQ
ncbi:MAG: T9SS type A sorting domain-containing protein [Ignavibacteriales bacterium]|nr:T9SS type A sorting domain-containing protein [Ignavibacteriales bacterium]